MIQTDAVDVIQTVCCAVCDTDNVCDTDTGREKMLECGIAVTIAELLGTEVGNELQDNILELLANLAENGKYQRCG